MPFWVLLVVFIPFVLPLLNLVLIVRLMRKGIA